MVDIIEEVLNEQKEERRVVLFQKIFPIVIIGAVIIALIIAFYSWYSNRRVAHNQEIGNLLVELVLGKAAYNIGDVNSDLESIVTNDQGRQSELASLKIVHNKIAANDVESALVDLVKIIEAPGFYKFTTAYARVLWLSLILDKPKLTEAEQMEARNYFQFFSDENQEFYATAMLLKAFFYQKNNDMGQAKEAAEKILKMKEASPIIKEQAKALLSGI